LDSRLEGISTANVLAREVMEKRLEGMAMANILAREVVDKQFGFIEKNHSQCIDRVGELEKSKAYLNGKATEGSVNTAMIVAVVGVLLGLAGLVVEIIRVVQHG
jgi:ABC-type bacteriocin/lantibiotic exporter with double-glycine peptidase domain